MSDLEKGLVIDIGSPVGIGSGRADLVHKCHGWLHSARISASSWARVATLSQGIVSWTADLGAEAKFSN
eukprot:3721541-Alexandrium_andersonii.AAC.1